jgi:ribonuclease HII
MFGIDEAGRGPVIGPMVVAGLKGSEKELPEQVDDSKNLTSKQREHLNDILRENFEYTIVCVSPKAIDKDETNINNLTAAAQSKAIKRLDNPVNGFVDACDTNEKRFETIIIESIGTNINVTATHGADEKYPIVSAASIIAKVERDNIIDALDSSFEYDIGSGYPSDSTTREFLKDYYKDNSEFPACVRTSWKTAKDIREDCL